MNTFERLTPDICGRNLNIAAARMNQPERFPGGIDTASVGIHTIGVTIFQHLIQNPIDFLGVRRRIRYMFCYDGLIHCELTLGVADQTISPVIDFKTLTDNCVGIFSIPKIIKQTATQIVEP